MIRRRYIRIKQCFDPCIFFSRLDEIIQRDIIRESGEDFLRRVSDREYLIGGHVKCRLIRRQRPHNHIKNHDGSDYDGGHAGGK